MLTWVPFYDIANKHIELIAQALIAAPVVKRLTANDVVEGLRFGSMRLFEFEGGIVVVSKEDTRLHIDALTCGNLNKAWLLVEPLKRLATDWQCDTIETTVFDERLARGIVKLGGRIETIGLILSVEQSDGQIENEEHD